jgi:glycosyltransferase involved in cell wall biosynthesis
MTKVLMLGWEFPPHISGGLGTACHGLTKGLAQHGVDVSFVLPRRFGDEHAEHLKLIGCNDLDEPAAVEGAAAHASTSALPQLADSPERRTLLELARKSLALSAQSGLLSAYMSPHEYRARWRELGSEQHCSADAAWRELWSTLLALPALAPSAEMLSRTLGSCDSLELSGHYGPDLMLEVGRYAAAVALIAREGRYDLIHAHDWMTYPAGLVASALMGLPLVAHVHASEFDRSGESQDERIRELESLGLRAASRVICVSHYTAGIVRKSYGVAPSRLRVVHNAVAGQVEAALPREKAIPEPIVLFLGRVTFQKGPDYFVEAAARVAQVFPKVKFVMAGSGDMWPVMVERAARLGLARHFHFTGFLRGADVDRIYRMADVFVMPSVSEPFGISPLEAIARGVPVIVSKQSGVSEVVQNALKADFWDVRDLADKILALLSRPVLRELLVEGGREEVRQMKWERSAERVRAIYDEVLAATPPLKGEAAA